MFQPCLLAGGIAQRLVHHSASCTVVTAHGLALLCIVFSCRACCVNQPPHSSKCAFQMHLQHPAKEVAPMLT